MAKGGKFRKVTVFVLALILVCGVLFAAKYIEDKRMMLMYPLKYTEQVELCSEKYHISPEILYAVIHTESGFDERAVSGAGACGLMQIMPDTYDWLLYTRRENERGDLFDPETNIEYGAYFLSYLYKKFGNWDTAFAAYNAGMNRVTEWLLDTRYSDGEVLTSIPYTETANYVKKVNNAIEKYRKIYDM